MGQKIAIKLLLVFFRKEHCCRKEGKKKKAKQLIGLTTRGKISLKKVPRHIRVDTIVDEFR